MMRDKKYLQILAIIGIFFASFLFVKPVKAEDWLTGWDQRIKFTIDYTKIDSTLTWFPVTVFLTSTQGEEVFAEFDANSDYLKVAFTKDDGITELYAEKELFDDAGQKAIYHVSKTGWTISSTADTEFYMYYDNDHADNTTYIGAINTAAGATVWDSYFEAVYHMADATVSTISDSTSNNRDGTKRTSNNPLQVLSAMGYGQDFEHSNLDFITLNWIHSGAGAAGYTIEAWADVETNYDEAFMFSTDNSLDLRIDSATTWKWSARWYATYNNYTLSTASAPLDLRYIAGTMAETATNVLYLDGASVDTDTANIYGLKASSYNTTIGCKNSSPSGTYFDGKIYEIRCSSIQRNAAWIKATYNNLVGTLLNYGNEELSGLANGSACSVNEDCSSGNCQNSICCTAGQTCCSSDSQCPTDFFENCQFSDYSCDTTTDHYCKSSIDIWCYRINSTQQKQIDKHSVCKDVTNNNASDIFVPTKIAAEWTAFRTYASGVSIAECTLPCDDDDDDGYGECPACGIANGCTYDGDDCCDIDNRAYPGESTYYSLVNNCSSWDYDCSGATDKSDCTVRGVSQSNGYTCYWDGCVISRGGCYENCTELAPTELNCSQSGYYYSCASGPSCACGSPSNCLSPGCCPPCYMLVSSARNCVCR